MGYLLHKHPDKLQSVEMPAGQAHIFYPIAKDDICSVCLLLDIDPVLFARKNKANRADLTLAHYVNDRPYVASSFLSVALAKSFNTAMNGHCKQMPHLVEEIMPFEVSIAVLPAPKGGEKLIRSLFEPLGYTVNVTNHPLDERFPEWGRSKYYTVSLAGAQTLKSLLSHLYVLIPALDYEKHYWIGESEVNKLLDKGKDWLPTHPERTQITNRYLKNLRPLTRLTTDRLIEMENPEDTEEAGSEEHELKKVSLHQQRLDAVLEVLVSSGAKSVLDLGCGEGKLLKMLLKEHQFQQIMGMDVSHRSLGRAADNLRLERMPAMKRERINLIQGSLTYRDDRLAGYDAAAVVEVIEHLEEDRLATFAAVLFGHARPKTVVLTTPNRTYNQLFENMKENTFRHNDHRFEWTEAEFEKWVLQISEKYGYEGVTKPLGESHPEYGPPSQMAIFQQINSKTSA